MPSPQTPLDGIPAANKLRMVHGAVSTVRAVPSKEVSVISVEIPDEHHVQATILVHGRYALILRSALEKGSNYGVLDVDLGSAANGTGAQDPLAFAMAHEGATHEAPTIVHARVAMVRPIPSRMVTAIYLEVPDAQHVEITNLLHGRDAILFPVTLPRQAPLGILNQNPPSHAQAAGQPQARPGPPRSMTAVSVGSSASMGARAHPPGLGRRLDTLVVTRWLGAQCASESFQDFLGVRTEAAARNKVCEICGVASRAEIRDRPEAMKAFLTSIYHPFDRFRLQHAPGEAEPMALREVPTA